MLLRLADRLTGWLGVPLDVPLEDGGSCATAATGGAAPGCSSSEVSDSVSVLSSLGVVVPLPL
jgi:hypothetical protein